MAGHNFFGSLKKTIPVLFLPPPHQSLTLSFSFQFTPSFQPKQKVMEVAVATTPETSVHASTLADPAQVFVVSGNSTSVPTLPTATTTVSKPTSAGNPPSDASVSLTDHTTSVTCMGGAAVGITGPSISLTPSVSIDSSKTDDSDESDDEVDDNLEIIVEGEEEEDEVAMETSSSVSTVKEHIPSANSSPPVLKKAVQNTELSSSTYTTVSSSESNATTSSVSTTATSSDAVNVQRSSKECAKVKQFFTTLQTFANKISRDVAEQVQELITALVVSADIYVHLMAH